MNNLNPSDKQCRTLPPQIVQAMKAQDLLPTMETLADKTGVPISTLYRLFSPECKHKGFIMAIKIAKALNWTPEVFLELSTRVPNDQMGLLISRQLATIGKSHRAFTNEIFPNKQTWNGSSRYTTGSVAYGRLKVYTAIARVTGLDLRALAELFLINLCTPNLEIDASLNATESINLSLRKKQLFHYDKAYLNRVLVRVINAAA